MAELYLAFNESIQLSTEPAAPYRTITFNEIDNITIKYDFTGQTAPNRVYSTFMYQLHPSSAILLGSSPELSYSLQVSDLLSAEVRMLILC